MGKYKVLSQLWSISRNRYVLVGEEIDFDDEGAEILLAKGVIEPAKGGRAIKKNIEVEAEQNGSDNESD